MALRYFTTKLRNLVNFDLNIAIAKHGTTAASTDGAVTTGATSSAATVASSYHAATIIDADIHHPR